MVLPKWKTVVVGEVGVWETLEETQRLDVAGFLKECFASAAGVVTLGFCFLDGEETVVDSSFVRVVGKEEQREQLLALYEELEKCRDNKARVIWLVPNSSQVGDVLTGMLLANASKIDWITMVKVDPECRREVFCNSIFPLIARGIHVTLCELNQLVQHKMRRQVALQTGVVWRGCLTIQSESLCCKGVGLRLTKNDCAPGDIPIFPNAGIQLLRFIGIEQFLTCISYFVGPELSVFCLDKIIYPEAYKFLHFMFANPKDILIAKQTNGQLIAFRTNDSGRLVATMIKKDSPVLQRVLLGSSGSENGFGDDIAKDGRPGPLVLRAKEFTEKSMQNSSFSSLCSNSVPSIEVELPKLVHEDAKQRETRIRQELLIVQKQLESFEEHLEPSGATRPSLQLRPATGSVRRTNVSNRVARKRGEHMVAMNSSQTPGRSSLRTRVRANDLTVKSHKRLARENRLLNSSKRKKKLQRKGSSKEKVASFKASNDSARKRKLRHINIDKSSSLQAERGSTEFRVDSSTGTKTTLRERNLAILRKLVEAEVESSGITSQDILHKTIGYALSILTDHYSSMLEVSELCQDQVKDKLAETCKFAVFLKGSQG